MTVKFYYYIKIKNLDEMTKVERKMTIVELGRWFSGQKHKNMSSNPEKPQRR